MDSDAFLPVLLIVDGNDDDAKLIENELLASGMSFKTVRAHSLETFSEVLKSKKPDLVLCECSLEGLGDAGAMTLLKQHGCDAPLVIITRAINEDHAVAYLRHGAVDYLLKENVLRLPAAVLNILKRHEADKQRVVAVEALRRSEEQFLQSQKLEAIGRLAGGVAHDFNNLLTVIIGYTQILLRRPPQKDGYARGQLEEIEKAGTRACDLTNQLLAFSRKQILQPRVLDINVLVEDMGGMLRRLISAEVSLSTKLAADAGRVKVDRGQLEQVLMNLVVNAADAMPDGGTLTIETARVELDESFAQEHLGLESGSYAMLAVSDTGCGMDEKTQLSIFEPFFTTKESGKGTGLGLSTVYGIVKQSGGGVWVYSEVDKGSSFKIYLPAVNATSVTEEPVPGVNRAASMEPATETIMVVEDSDAVRRLARAVLEQNGYQVIEAASPAEALEMCKTHNTCRFDLLLTDVVMPGMTGRELADRLSVLRPGTLVLYMSGYTEDSIIQRGIVEKGTHFITKPFTPNTLTAKIREVLLLARSRSTIAASYPVGNYV